MLRGDSKPAPFCVYICQWFSTIGTG